LLSTHRTQLSLSNSLPFAFSPSFLSYPTPSLNPTIPYYFTDLSQLFLSLSLCLPLTPISLPHPHLYISPQLFSLSAVSSHSAVPVLSVIWIHE
ncbi:hypothetical protein FKM82_015763, partial [Ascaphus truei]